MFKFSKNTHPQNPINLFSSFVQSIKSQFSIHAENHEPTRYFFSVNRNYRVGCCVELVDGRVLFKTRKISVEELSRVITISEEQKKAMTPLTSSSYSHDEPRSLWLAAEKLIMQTFDIEKTALKTEWTSYPANGFEFTVDVTEMTSNKERLVDCLLTSFGFTPKIKR